MKKRTRRYLFTSYEELGSLQFEQFELICDRLFLFVSESQEHIPLPLVINLQKLGRGVRWIKTHSGDLHTNRYLLSFMLGKLHEKLPSDIEFALLSDDTDLDELISLINRKGRTCLRILANENIEEEEVFEPVPVKKLKAEPSTGNGNGESAAAKSTLKEESKITLQLVKEEKAPEVGEEATIREKAQTITSWLMRSGNRPAEIGLLQQYISLNNPELKPGNAEKIITFMAMNNDIQIKEKEVMYNF